MGVFAYLGIGALVGIITEAEMAEIELGGHGQLPEGSGPGIGLLAGLLWPLTIVAFAGWLLLRAGRALARSFAVLWGVYPANWLQDRRDRRNAKLAMPKATARRTK